jgi:hypothetical protein
VTVGRGNPRHASRAVVKPERAHALPIISRIRAIVLEDDAPGGQTSAASMCIHRQ